MTNHLIDRSSKNRTFNEYCFSIASNWKTENKHPRLMPDFAIYLIFFSFFFILYLPVWITIKKSLEINSKINNDKTFK